MSTLKKYDLQGKEVGTVKVSKALAEAQTAMQMVKDYIVAIRKNNRQWSASTKGRSEVKHTTKKPHPQKGTGRARQGCLVSPQFKGGGVVFGPKPKFNQHVKINRKEKLSAIKFLIGEKIREGKLLVVDSLRLKKPATKDLISFVDNTGLKGKILFIGEGTFDTLLDSDTEIKISVKNDDHQNLLKSIQNIPAAKFSLAKNINGYQLACARGLVVSENALREIENWLGA